MQSIHRSVVSRPAMAHGGSGRVRSVSVDAPIEMVAALLASRQLSAVPVIDEYGVQVGVVSMTSMMAGTDEVDPMFAGIARRRWYHLPAAATAGDFMIPAAPELGRVQARAAAGGPYDDLRATG